MRLTALQRFALHVGARAWQACEKRGCPSKWRADHLRLAWGRELAARQRMRRGRP